MASSTLHRSLVLVPHRVTARPKGHAAEVELPLGEVLAELARDVEIVTGLAEWHLRSDRKLLDDLQEIEAGVPGARLGSVLGISFPKDVLPRRTGASRMGKMAVGRVAAEGRSWLERHKAAAGEHEGYVSAGWKRTANGMRPDDIRPLMRLSDADGQYSNFVGDPLSGEFALDVVVNGRWVRFHFRVKRRRIKYAKKLTKPTIRPDADGVPVFQFTKEIEYQYVEFSDRYVIGVDVGRNAPATVVVVDTKTGDIVHATQLSHRVASQKNSIKASAEQVRNLRKKGRPEEAAEHRRANIGKKAELAIIAGQEIADLSYFWGNALVVVEDLSWVKNTMANGRWNRGELVRRTRDMVELNGGRVVTVNPANTSQLCHKCGMQLEFPKYQDAVCVSCGTLPDRDINAAANIAKRFVGQGSWVKVRATRKKSKRYRKGPTEKRTAPTRQSLKYPGRDRAKNQPTPSQAGPEKVQSLPVPTMREGVNPGQCSATHVDDGTVVADVRASRRHGRDPQAARLLALLAPLEP